MKTNREYTDAVARGEYPEDPEVPQAEPFVNQNGAIQNLLLADFKSVAMIESRKGSVRANHYHKEDWHYTLVLAGQVEYVWRPHDRREIPKTRRFQAGQIFFTPPMVEHAMIFPVTSHIITFAKRIRDTESHEEDVVRIPFIETGWDPLKGPSFHLSKELVEELGTSKPVAG